MVVSIKKNEPQSDQKVRLIITQYWGKHQFYNNVTSVILTAFHGI